jgi:ABC-type lipoprotein export system ATPase subunit
MVRTQGLSVVTVTHDSTLLAMADEVKEMRDGGLHEAHEAGVSAGRFVASPRACPSQAAAA